MNPRAMSVWICSAASSAVSPRFSVQARASVSPAVKYEIRSSCSNRSRQDALERRRAVAELRRLLGRKPGQLELELGVDPRRAVLDHDQWLRRQRVERLGHTAGKLAQRTVLRQELESRLQLHHLVAQRGVAGLRLLPDALEPALHVLLVGDEQLEMKRGKVGFGIRTAREGVDHGDERICAPERPELRRARSRRVENA